MGRMVRKQLYLTDEQDRGLAESAQALGVSQAEIVRLAIDVWLDNDPETRREAAWRDLRRLMDEASAMGVGGQTGPDGERTWTREDLYEERLRRHDR